MKEPHEDLDHIAVMVGKPRHVVFTDEFIGKLIKVVNVQKITLQTLDGQKPEAVIDFKHPQTKEEYIIRGEGPTMGHALREILDQVADILGMDREEF